MKRVGVLIMIGALLAVLLGCGSATGSFLDPSKVKDVIVYQFGSNGKDTITFTPSTSGGLSGTYAIETYSYKYPTQAATDTATHTYKEWFMTGGRRGTYAYDGTTMILKLTTTEVFRRTDLAVTANSSFKADYNWLALTTLDQSAAWAKDYVQTEEFTAAFTEDNLLGGISNLLGETTTTINFSLVFVANTTDATKWTSTTTATYVDGTWVQDVFEYTITSTGVSTSYTYTSKPQGTAATGSWVHFTKTTASTLNSFFLHTVATGTTKFADAWKQGNTLTFKTVRTSKVVKNWVGSVVPATTPSVDKTTGWGITGAGAEPVRGDANTAAWYENLYQTPEEYVFGHRGTFIYGAALNLAGRSLE